MTKQQETSATVSDHVDAEAENGPEHGLLYGIDDIPPPLTSLTLGFQHYLTMFGSTVAIPLLLKDALGMKDPADLAMLIGTMFFVSGIATLLQVTFGNRLPIIQGGTFSFLTPAFAICGMAALADAGWEVRMQHLQGAIIAGSLFEIFLGATGTVGRLLRFVGPITIAPTIALIGLSLFKFGAPIAGSHWPIGGLTIGLIILFSQYLKNKGRAFALFPIMLAIVGAWVVAAICSYMGLFEAPVMQAGTCVPVDGQGGHPSYVSTCLFSAAPYFRIPYPFQWGTPIFGAAAIIGMVAGYIASAVESIGDYYACARLAGAPPPNKKTINRGITMEGIGCLIAGMFGTGNGTTSYSENIGAIGLTRVGSRRVVQVGAGLMIVLGVVGKFGALFTTIPQPIVGGMYCAMFGMIAAVGLSNLQFVNLNSGRNLFILGFAFFMGLSLPEYFGANAFTFEWGVGWAQYLQLWGEAPIGQFGTVLEEVAVTFAGIVNTLGQTGMAVGAFIALILDNTIPGTDAERGLTAWSGDLDSDESGADAS